MAIALQFGEITSSSILFKVVGLSTSQGNKDVTVFYGTSTPNKVADSITLGFNETETPYQTLTGLSSNTLYVFYAFVDYTEGIDDYTLYIYKNTLSSGGGNTGGNGISTFLWDNEKESEGQFNITANEWNRLLNLIESVWVALGLSLNRLPYPLTKVEPTQPFTHEIYNNVGDDIIACIEKAGLGNTGVETGKAYGDIIYADDINALLSGINRVIRRL